MSKTRLELQSFLETLGLDIHVYFQAPSSVIMKYPAIRYNLADMDNIPADNTDYLDKIAYTLIYITKNPDDPMIRTISKIQYCKFDRWYASDNLNHYVYTLFY